jgi:hypothetical protein
LGALGLPLVLAWFVFYVRIIRESGLASARGTISTFLFSLAGIVAYPVLIVCYQLFLADQAMVPVTVFVLYAIAVAVCAALAVPVARGLERRRGGSRIERPSRSGIAGVLGAGTALVASLLILGPIRVDRLPPRVVVDRCGPIIEEVTAEPGWSVHSRVSDAKLNEVAWSTVGLSGYCSLYAVSDSLEASYSTLVVSWHFDTAVAARQRYDTMEAYPDSDTLQVEAVGEDRLLIRKRPMDADGKPLYDYIVGQLLDDRSVVLVESVALSAPDSFAVAAYPLDPVEAVTLLMTVSWESIR